MPTRPPYAHSAARPISTARRAYDRRRAADPQLAAAAALRNSAAWQHLRAHFLARHPICGACGAALATQVHHLQPVERRPDLALDWGNLAPVCTRCHGDCNARERQGLETASLFASFVRLSQFGGNY